MIRRTFQLIRGVGPSREKDLWASGISTWADFLASSEIQLSESLDKKARPILEAAQLALEARDLRSLASVIPSREHWRVYPAFRESALFFDIETDGSDQQCPTVVSVFHSKGFQVFVQGKNLDDLPETMGRWPLWVSFNGTGFDIPVLASHFGFFPEPEMHLDLRFVCRKLGLRGGLKRIEEFLGFARPPHLHGVNGLDAIILWKAFCETRDMAPLRRLVEYNLYDSIQLKTLVEMAFNLAVEKLGFNEERIEVFERGDILYDLSRFLLEFDLSQLPVFSVATRPAADPETGS